jgi:flagellar motor switch protein FliN
VSDDALIRLGRSTLEAITGILEMHAPGQVAPGDVTVVSGPFELVPAPAVASSVAYVDGVTGGNVFVMTLDGARRLSAANQMMSSAAIATSAVLGTEVEIGAPTTRTFLAPADARDVYPATPHAVRAELSVCGRPCSLVQLIPSAFVVRMTRALDELDAEIVAAEPALSRPPAVPAPSGGPSLAGIPVRVWAELGRARMPSARVVGMPAGAVVELNRSADEAIDVYVNGTRFASGRLVVVDGTDWAVRIEEIHASVDPEAGRWPAS